MLGSVGVDYFSAALENACQENVNKPYTVLGQAQQPEL